MGNNQCCSVCAKEHNQPIAAIAPAEAKKGDQPPYETAGSLATDESFAASPAALVCERKPDKKETAGLISTQNIAGSAEDSVETPSPVSPVHKEKKKDDTHFQVKRVESKDERDFAHQWDLSSRVVAELQGQVDFGPTPTDRPQEDDEVEIQGTRGSTAGGAPAGFSLNFPVTYQEAEALRVHYCKSGGRSDGRLNKFVAEELVQEFNEQYAKKHPNAVSEISVPAGGNVVVVGDTHGQLQDVLFIFHTFGPPSANNVYLFNGDVADRGHNACEIFFMIFAYFLADQNCILMNRGNHENPELNASPADSGGGFRDEVLKKYTITMYDQIVKTMCLLPLCTVIQNEVFVVHGGISAQPGCPDLTLDQIRSVDHTEFCCPQPETSVLGEKVWMDLIWSDPTPRKGAHESARGAGIRFGPDVTERFLKTNRPLRMIIRGHELPDGQRGYQKVHSGRVLTVFSASNYCGEAANQGAVAIFRSADFPSYTLHEYYAPSLKQIAALVIAGNKEWAKEGRLLSESEKTAKEEGWWHKELSKLMIAIVQMKPQIWTKFHEATHGERTVDHDTWIKLLSETVGAHWHWEMAWKMWGLGDLDAKIDFTNFLQRFSVVLRHDAEARLKYKNIACCFEKILEEHSNLSRTLHKFDADGSGMVTSKGLRAALKSLDLGLTRAQIDSMLHVLFNGKECDGVSKMPVQEFLGRFTMVYKHAEDALTAGERTSEERLLHDTMSRIAHVIASHSSKDINQSLTTVFEAEAAASRSNSRPKSNPSLAETSNSRGGKKEEPKDKKVPVTKDIAKKHKSTASKAKGSSAGTTGNASTAVALKIEQIFAIMDTEHSGFVSTDHFVRGIWAVPGMQDLTLQNGERLSQGVLQRCALLLDKHGQISILELLNALEFEDSHQGDGMADALAEHMLAVLFRYRLAVRAGARHFDAKAKGRVSEDQFTKVLMAVNKQIEDTGVHFTKSQISDLVTAISEEDQKGRSWVHYEEFFNSFEIVDAQNAAVGVAIKSKNH